MLRPEPIDIDSNAILAKAPSYIRAELKIILKLINDADLSGVVMVWLFGSYSRGDFINDIAVDNYGYTSEYHSDLDVLVVVSDPLFHEKQDARWPNLIRAFDKEPGCRTQVHAIGISFTRFCKALRLGQYFYEEIVEEGLLLQSTGVTLPSPIPRKPPQLRKFAIQAFEDFFVENVIGFQQNFETLYQHQSYRLASHVLHQVTENLFHCFLLVYTEKKPRTHDLGLLQGLVASHDPKVINVFPYHTKEQKRLHDLLIEAYVRGRYHVFNDDFIVTQADLDALGQQVGALQAHIMQLCVEKITSFITEEPFAYTAPSAFLDMNELKDRSLPEEALAKAIEEKGEALREKAKALQEKEEAEEREEQEREAKEQAIEREAVALREKAASEQREKQERKEKEEAIKEKEALRAKLKQAGIE